MEMMRWKRAQFLRLLSLFVISFLSLISTEKQTKKKKTGQFFLFVDAIKHYHTDYFPDNEEYDFHILDPDTVYGSPYGGFSRATRSRLAALPLHLPQIPHETPLEYEPLHVQVRDAEGRPFVCRVFHEDELDPSSWGESLFDTPTLHASFMENMYKNTEGLPSSMTEGSGDGSSALEGNRDGVVEGPSSMDENGGSGTPTQRTSQPSSPPTSGEPADHPASSSSTTTTITSGAHPQEQIVGVDGYNDGYGDAILSQLPSMQSIVSPKADTLLYVQLRLSELMGVCAQFHHGWWSYDWCFERFVSQFHVELTAGSVSITDSLSLGEFHRRIVDLEFLDDDGDDDDDDSAGQEGGNGDTTTMPSTRRKPNEWAENTPEIARVTDIHTGGDFCEETNERRTSYVHMQCCSPRIMARRKGLLHREGHPIEPGLASIFDIREDPDAVCTYNITVCTPLLCGEHGPDHPYHDQHDGSAASKSQGAGGSRGGSGSGSGGSGGDGTDAGLAAYQNGGAASGSPYASMTNPYNRYGAGAGNRADGPYGRNANNNNNDDGPREGETVLEILDRLLGSLCLQTSTGGWWTYEFCHGRKIRQYHEVFGIQKNSAGQAVSSKVVESEHILGQFDPSIVEGVTAENEWKFVVNATDTKKKGGNGAYLEVEYPGGDVCDHSDVTSSAIIAGALGSGGIERSSSVRYYCGNAYAVQVSEDATCHYIVEVTIPGICRHALFKAPVRKSQIVKCLPVEEEQSYF